MSARNITTLPENEWVELPAGFGIAPGVEQAADRWLLSIRQEEKGPTFLTCTACGQAVLVMAREGVPYRVRVVDIQSQLLTHLMQAHGWTREQAGTDGS